MPVERSAGAIIFRQDNNKPVFLLLHYPSGAKAKKEYWDLPKGHVEKRETLKDTVKREIFEETGIVEVRFLQGFKETIRYFFRAEGKTILKFVTFYLLKTKEKTVKISGEHIGYQWLPYQEAIEQLTFKNAKEILQKANDFLSEKGL